MLLGEMVFKMVPKLGYLGGPRLCLVDSIRSVNPFSIIYMMCRKGEKGGGGLG